MKNALLVLSFFLLINKCLADGYQEVYWDQLMPEGWEPPEYVIQHDMVFDYEPIDAPLVSKFNNQKVKVPGYVIPIVGDESGVSEFLLVPFIGACIHVPPPPENQMVYVKLDKPLGLDQLWTPVWAKGILNAKKTITKYANVGYVMRQAEAEIYPLN